ncbi:MAG: SRPBCC family protein, partial [Planctomycetota bacterium]
MARFTTTKRIEAPQAAVFQLFADMNRAADHLSGVVRLEKLTDGPVGKGTRFRETRVIFKKEATEELEITDFDPPRSYTVGCESCGCTYSTTMHFVPNGNVTDVEVEMESRPVTFMAKIMSPFTNLMMSKLMQKCFDKDLEDLKKVAES